jgi:DNA ligase-1
MTQDLEDEVLPAHLKFYCFDMITAIGAEEWFELRLDHAEALISLYQDIATMVNHEKVNSKEEVEALFEKALEFGCEGLMLRNPEGKYKYGRGTIKEGLIYKVKPFVTTDAQVIGIVQSTKVNEEVEKKTNELGRSVTSKKIGDRHLIEKASAVWVKYKNQELKVSLACTDEEKKEIWENRNTYIGKWIEYKYLEIGMKDGGLPRHPTSIRWRKDKD